MKLSVVIPARNEAEGISETLIKLSQELTCQEIDFELVVVNDHSTDHSAEVLLKLQGELPSLRLFDNLKPSGFGFCVRTGLESARGDAIAVYMADASDSPQDLVRFFRHMDQTQVDCVFGSRFMKESVLEDYPFHKLVLNRLVNFLIMVLFGIRYNDVTNAFKLYSRRTLQSLGPFLSCHYNLTVELPLKAIVRGHSYAVLPNSWVNRKHGVSKLKIREMGSRYLFIVMYCFIEKWLSRGDYRKENVVQDA